MTHIGQTYEEWRAEQEAQGMQGRRSTKSEDKVRWRQLEGIAKEGMFGYVDDEWSSGKGASEKSYGYSYSTNKFEREDE